MLSREMKSMFEYSDWANGRVLHAAGGLGDELLDRPLDLGPGSLRRIVIHTYNGEHVWLRRWRGEAETAWPSESQPLPIADVARRFAEVWRERAAFLEKLDEAALASEQRYRDSKGSVFVSRLGDMITQGLLHSVHHRAQAVNALRRLGGPIVELDYMMRIRRAATAP